MFKNLRAEIARLGMSQKEFAKAVGIKGSTFTQKINGKVDFNLSEIKRIKSFFGGKLSIEYLFEIED